MIEKTLSFLAEELNSFISNKDFNYRNKNVAMVCDLTDYKGEPTFKKKISADGDFLLLTLINVEEEVVGKNQVAVYKKPDESLELLNPDLRINLYLLISAVSSLDETQRYDDCLRVLSYCVGFFQYKYVFESNNSPSLPAELRKIIVDLVSPTFEQQNHIWGGIGAKYQPSVLYKIRMLVYREILDKDSDLRIRKVDAKINSN